MYVGSFVIPIFATLWCLYMMNRPYQQQGDYDFGMIFRLGWLLPIGFVWAIYFGIMLAIKTWS
jgi:hypothetical protein